MDKKIENKNKRSARRKPVTRPLPTTKKRLPTTKNIAYQVLTENGIPAKLAKSVVSVGENTGMSRGTIAQQREHALQALDITLYSQFKTLKDIRDDTQKSCQSDRIHAVKTLNTMIPGFLAPQEVNVNNTSVMIEFNSLSSQELLELSGELSGQIQGSIDDADFQDIDNKQVESQELIINK